MEMWRGGESLVRIQAALPHRTLNAIRVRAIKLGCRRCQPGAPPGADPKIVGVRLGRAHRRWLAQFGPRGASGAIRRLIEEAMAGEAVGGARPPQSRGTAGVAGQRPAAPLRAST